MKRFRAVLVAFAALSIVFCNGAGDNIDPSVILRKATRLIDLTAHVAKIKTTLILENGGSAPVQHIHYVLEPSHAQNLALISATLENSDNSVSELQVTLSGKSDSKKGQLFKISLPTSLSPSGSITVTVETIFTNILEPYPAEITQAEKQLIRYRGNHYIFSPYKIVTQTTTVKLATSNVISHSQLKPSQLSENVLTYGSYEDQAPYAFDKMNIHYENNGPFLVVTSLTRVIEVSHWGNIAVEETFSMKHSGAKLKGSFSRYDYQRNPSGSGVSSIRSFKTLLPATAADVYYRDEIGNISTSNMLPLDEAVELEIRPRFPLFGGWQTQYCVGYNMPTHEYLYYQGSQFKLNMRFLDHIYDDQVIDEMTLRIILPEGAKNIKLSAPYPVTEKPRELHYTYLDTCGRPVIVAAAKNLVENHIQNFELEYEFSGIYMLQEPFLVVSAFFIIFFSVIILTRIDFTIVKDPAREARLKASGSKELVDSLCSQLHDVFTRYNEAIRLFRENRDTKTFQSARKSMDATIKDMLTELGRLKNDVASGDPEAGDKVSKLESLEKEYVNYLKDSVRFAESGGKSGKERPHVSEKMEEILAEIDGILNSL